MKPGIRSLLWVILLTVATVSDWACGHAPPSEPPLCTVTDTSVAPVPGRTDTAKLSIEITVCVPRRR